MRHRKFTFKIGRTGAHRKAMVANAVCSLIMENRIKTTVTKAKQIRRVAEKMVTLGKRGSLHARRRAVAILRQKEAVSHLFREVAPRYEGRDGGYTRILRLGTRTGDAAEMCLLEFLDEAVEPKAASASVATDGDGATSEGGAAEDGATEDES